jgi:hypothetical protein
LNHKSPRRFLNLPSAIVAAGLVIGAGFLTSSYFGTATTMTQTSIVTTTATSTTTATKTIGYATVENGPLLYSSAVSPDGLQLKVTLNTSSILSHGAVTARIELLNTLNRNISLPIVANQNMSRFDGQDFLCDVDNPSDSFLVYAVFKGHFSAANTSAAGYPLRLAPPLYPPCPFRLPLNGTTFLPNSDNTFSLSYSGKTQQPSYRATAEINATTGSCVGSGFSGHGGSIDCGANPGLVGYWSPNISPRGNLNFTSPAFVYFPSGEYTIVAADDWNQYVYAYFTVL